MNNFPRQLMHAAGNLVLDPTRLMLQFKQPVERNNLLRLLSEIGLQLEDGTSYDQQTQERPVPGEVVNNSSTRVFVQSRIPITQERFLYIQTSAIIFGLDFIAPVYRIAGQTGRRALVVPLPNVLVVRLNERTGSQNVPTQLDLPPILAAATFPTGAAPRLQEVPEKSRYLNGFRYYTIQNPQDVNAYQLRAILQGDITRQVFDVQFETIPLIKPTAATPSDVLFTQQWDMVRIGATGGWDISIGDASVIVAILDEGVDLAHPDLAFASSGIDLGTMALDGSPNGTHGTPVAGVVGALFNNGVGTAGVAGGIRILPIAFDSWSDVEVAMGLNYARLNGADVINMSFGFNGWSQAIINPAIAAAHAANIVLVAATHNYNGAITYPATHPLVIAVGASDEVDNRKSPSSPDMETWWGSNYGPQLSVVAPGVHIPTTDQVGTAGINTTPGAAGNNILNFNGTSAATPHVAGLAALIRSVYPTLTNVQIRNLIERSAEKVGTVPYGVDAAHPAGTWNQEMGYGRINVLRALDTADLLIRDAVSDTGTEPSPGVVFWNSPDVFISATPEGNRVVRGQANTLYVRITNNGPRAARNVVVSARVTPFVGLQFVYPFDWTLIDPLHVVPAETVLNTFANIPAFSSMFAEFRISAAQTETLFGWQEGANWHPCVLVSVVADNDYAFATAPLTTTPITPRLNNLAQRNVTVVNIGAGAGARAVLPFIAGSRYNPERSMTLVIDRSQIPQGAEVLLSLDDDGSAFPLVDFVPPQRDPDDQPEEDGCGASSLVFLEPTRIQTRLGCSNGIMTLARGSRFDCAPVTTPGQVQVIGGDVVVRGNRRYVNLVAPRVTVQLQKAPNQIYPMALHVTLPAGVAVGQQFTVDIAQQNTQGEVVGGASAVFQVGATQ